MGRAVSGHAEHASTLSVGAARVACPEGLEPPTYSLEGYCSIQLSYGQQAGAEREGLHNLQSRAHCAERRFQS